MLSGCKKNTNENISIDQNDNNITPTISVNQVVPTVILVNEDTFNGEAIIESETYTDNGYYLTWYKEKDELIIAFLPSEFITEYNYPVGTKVNIDAIKDGTVKTISGNDAYRITSIEYIENIDFTSTDVEYLCEIEGSVYVEEQYEIDGNTYVVFGFEFDPNYYYYGRVKDPTTNMVGNHFYFYAAYNEGDLYEGKQYCEITSWEAFEYIIPTYDESIIETEDQSEFDTPSLYCTKKYDSAYYSEDSGIWLVGNTITNGKPFQISGIKYLYLEDGFLYFMGEMVNNGKRSYKIELNIELYDENEFLIDTITESDAFIYDDRLDWNRITEPSSYSYNVLYRNSYLATEYEGYGVEIPKLDFVIPGNENSNFTFLSFNQKDYPSRIYDTYDLREINDEIYYIYVTIKSYTE